MAPVPLHADQRGKLMLSYNIDIPSIACEHCCMRSPLDAPFRSWKCQNKRGLQNVNPPSFAHGPDPVTVVRDFEHEPATWDDTKRILTLESCNQSSACSRESIEASVSRVRMDINLPNTICRVPRDGRLTVSAYSHIMFNYNVLTLAIHVRE